MNISCKKAFSGFNHLFKCKSRFLEKKIYRKLINACILSTKVDEHPYAQICILNTKFYGLLDSEASVSILGKGSIVFIESNNIRIKPFKCKISTANGAKVQVLITKMLFEKLIFMLSPK